MISVRADDDGHPGLHVGVAGLADAAHRPFYDPDVGLDDPPVVRMRRW